MIGTALAHYRITGKLGAGGMGEVWRATDTKLDREVALKVRPEVFAGDPERLARFEREAKVLASLNHPNIAHLYGLETIEADERTVGEGFTPSRETVSSGTGTDAESGHQDLKTPGPQDLKTSGPVTFLVAALHDKSEPGVRRVGRRPADHHRESSRGIEAARGRDCAELVCGTRTSGGSRRRKVIGSRRRP